MQSQASLLLRAVVRRLRLAQAALTWERLWPALWPATAVVGLFLAAALFGLFQYLPPWLHMASLLAFAVVLGLAVWRGLRGFRLPDVAEARRRLEVKSGFSHRPLEALSDTIPQSPDRSTQLLWAAHQRRALDMVKRIRVGLPEAGLGRVDPYGLRAALTMVLVIGFVYAGGSWQDRIFDAFGPRAGAAPMGQAKSELTAWIAPPTYTGVAPIFLAQPASAPLSAMAQGKAQGKAAAGTPKAAQPAGPAVLHVPAGSTFFARVHGGTATPEVQLDATVTAFEAVDPANFQVSLPLTEGRALSVNQGRDALGKWQIDVVADAPPTIAFARGAVGMTKRMALQIDYATADDYGVVTARMKIKRDGVASDKLAFDLALPGINPRNATGTRFFDLTPHHWAGLPVVIWLEAVDGLGQIGRSEEMRMPLPERQFRNPVAKAIVEQRRNLAADPANRDDVAFALDAVTEALAPEIDDFGTYLDLRSSIGQLTYDRRPEAVPEVIDRLWDTALRLEDGELGPAERDLRRAQQALQDALQRDAPDEEVERLMAELQQAMDRYLQEMAQQAQRDQQNGQQQNQQMSDNQQQLTRQDLQNMLDQAREMSRQGAREQAQHMLQQLQRMLENLRMGRPMQGQGQAEQAMRELGEIIQRQQELMDRTFQQAQRGQFGDDGQLPQPGEQEGVRGQLGEMMRGLGERNGQIPQSFGEAERAMRGAAQALEGQNAGEALAQQGQALDRLREMGQQMMEQFMAMGQMPGQGLQQGQRPNPNVDPLGRPIPGMGADISNRTEIPDKADLQRAREILEELFRRAGERFRSMEELDYLNRLLRRF